MAQIKSKGQFAGTVGNVYFRTYNGKAIVQSKPGKGNVKQAEATKSAASDFGKASKTAKRIRLSLFPILQDLSDTNMYRRFTKAVYEASVSGNDNPKGSRSLESGRVSELAGFEFNSASPFEKWCKRSPEIQPDSDRCLIVNIPAFNLKDQLLFPGNTSHAALVYFIVAFDPDLWQQSQAAIFRIDLAKAQTAQDAMQFTTTPFPEGHVILVLQAVFYFRNTKLAGMVGANSRQLHPCNIVSAFRL